MSGSQSMTENRFGFVLTVHTEVTLWKIWCISGLFPHVKAVQNGMVRFVYTLIQKQICITHQGEKHCGVNVVLFLLSLTVCRSLSEQWPCLTVWEMSVFVRRWNLLWSFLLHNGRGPCNLPACCAWCSSVISWIFLQSESSCSLHRLIKAGVSLWPCRRDGGGLQRATPSLSSNWMGFGEMTTSAWHGALQSTPVPCAVPHPCLLLSVYAGECSELIYGSLSRSVLGLCFSKGLSLNGESPLLLTPFTLRIMCRDYWFISCCEFEVGHAEALRRETWDILQDQ